MCIRDSYRRLHTISTLYTEYLCPITHTRTQIHYSTNYNSYRFDSELQTQSSKLAGRFQITTIYTSPLYRIKRHEPVPSVGRIIDQRLEGAGKSRIYKSVASSYCSHKAYKVSCSHMYYLLRVSLRLVFE